MDDKKPKTSTAADAVDAADAPDAGSVTTATATADELASQKSYSSQNDEPINAATRLEIARVARCIRALAAEGMRIEEAALAKAYEVAVDLMLEEGDMATKLHGVVGDDMLNVAGIEQGEQEWQRRVVEGMFA